MQLVLLPPLLPLERSTHAAPNPVVDGHHLVNSLLSTAHLPALHLPASPTHPPDKVPGVALTSEAYSSTLLLMGTTITCLGDSHRGHLPPKCSVRMAIIRSTLPSTALRVQAGAILCHRGGVCWSEYVR